MTRSEIIETMARAMCERTFPGHDRKPAGASYLTPWERDGHVFAKDATAALSALEAAGLAVVPVRPTEEMISALQSYAVCAGYIEEGYAALIAAAQGAQKP